MQTKCTLWFRSWFTLRHVSELGLIALIRPSSNINKLGFHGCIGSSHDWRWDVVLVRNVVVVRVLFGKRTFGCDGVEGRISLFVEVEVGGCFGGCFGVLGVYT